MVVVAMEEAVDMEGMEVVSMEEEVEMDRMGELDREEEVDMERLGVVSGALPLVGWGALVFPGPVGVLMGVAVATEEVAEDMEVAIMAVMAVILSMITIVINARVLHLADVPLSSHFMELSSFYCTCYHFKNFKFILFRCSTKSNTICNGTL
jgi:hypothetical protein